VIRLASSLRFRTRPQLASLRNVAKVEVQPVPIHLIIGELDAARIEGPPRRRRKNAPGAAEKAGSGGIGRKYSVAITAR